MGLRSAFLAAAAAVLCGCAPASAPNELSGLWARGPGGCAAGMGVRFDASEVVVVAGQAEQVLLEQARYSLAAHGDALSITIEYRPEASGTARGLMQLERGPDGVLAVRSHQITDTRTGLARAGLALSDQGLEALSLRRCGEAAWIDGLRGRARTGSGPALRGDV